MQCNLNVIFLRQNSDTKALRNGLNGYPHGQKDGKKSDKEYTK